MKKMLVAMSALALVAQAVSAADVYSSNIVGYSKITLNPGFTMVGAPFQEVGAAGTVNVQDIVKTTGLVGYDWVNFLPGDSLLIWNATAQGYTQIFLWADSDPEGYLGTSNVWFDEGTLTPADVDLPVGSAVWIQSTMASASEGTVAGEVAATSAGEDVPFSAGFTMVANPFPYPLDINADMTPTGLVGYDWVNFLPGDSLLIWNATAQGYTQIYLWADSDPEGYLGTSNVWFDEGTLTPADVQIPVGGAFWILSSGSGGTIDFAAP